ncbi:MAG: hypothetical protein OXF77_03100 [Thaumarchaeota archaeon]|nr:hypothetical protein [Nitrososphaerota archaeon]
MLYDEVITSLFNANVYEIILELEQGSKDILYLENKLKISKIEIKKRIAPLIKFNFISVFLDKDQTQYTLNTKKLSKVVDGKFFDNVTDKLTILNSFLN